MSSKSRSVRRLSMVALGALAVLPASRALAFEPASATEAQQMADQYRYDADHYRALGGVGYKTGMVQRAEADEARYNAMAEEMSAPVAEPPAPTPKAMRYGLLADRYRAMGGFAFKTGLVQGAEAEERKSEAPPTSTEATAAEPTPAQCLAMKPAVRPPSCGQQGD
jgi:hypothetical protein